MLQNSNNGMFLETIINNTNLYYKNNYVALFFKRNLPIKIFYKKEKNISGKLYQKSETDYYGLYQGRYIDFEAKQTNKDKFNLSNLKQHQLEHLKMVQMMKGIAFLIIYFSQFDDFFCITIDLIKNNQKYISYDWCIENAYKLNLIFPGRLNLNDFLDLLI